MNYETIARMTLIFVKHRISVKVKVFLKNTFYVFYIRFNVKRQMLKITQIYLIYTQVKLLCRNKFRIIFTG